MFSTCNAACTGVVTLTKTDQCDVYQRSEVPVRLIIAKCDTDFPEGDYDSLVLAEAIETLITAGSISATPELADVSWGDPQTATKQYRARCRPASVVKTMRVLTGKDYNATDVDTTGSVSAYEDRLFFKNIIQNKGVAIRGYVTCDGKIYLFLNENGTFASYTVNLFTGFDTDIEGKSVEFKNYEITFHGDPVDYTTPYCDIIAAAATTELGWLYESAQ